MPMSASSPPSDDLPAVDGRSEGTAVASGKSLNPGTAMAGRERELARIESLLAEAAAGRCRVLLVEGEPGVGKTTLLDAGRVAADGFTCLSACGVESEQKLAHAGLLGLLNPIRSLLHEVPQTQATALQSALGWSPVSASEDRFLVGAATLSLLAAAAERRPVLVLVDDMHWLDPESSAAIVFAARRLGPDAVAFVLSARADSVPSELARGVSVLRLEGLSATAAASVLPAGTTQAVLERLVADTRGNPLALLEVSRRLDDAQLVGAAPLPDPLPAGDRLGSLYQAALAGLSPAAWQAVLLLAVAGAGGTANATVAAVLAGSNVDPGDALDEARQHGVLIRDGTVYGFRHPLLRSTVLQVAAPTQQRQAHAALAEALPVGSRERVWHLAEAALGRDANLAEQLARLADLDRSRLGYAAASVALERASDLTPDPGLAARRRALSAHDAFVAGDVERVRALAGQVLSGAAPEGTRGEVLFVLGMLEQYVGSVPASVELLNDAAYLLDGPVLVRALAELAMARFRLNDFVGVGECAQRIDAAADLADPEQQLLAHFTGGLGLILTGDLDAGVSRLAEVRQLADSPALRYDARALLLMALAASYTGQVADAVSVGAPRVQEVRRRGAVGALVPILTMLAAGKAWLGDHTGAFADAGEAAELAAHLGYAADASVAVEMLAWQLAARGLHEDARDSLAKARELIDRAGITSYAAHHALTAAFCALCRGDLLAVVSLLEQRITVDGGVGAGGEPLGVAPLLVEAYIGLTRLDEARSLTARYADVTPAASPPLSVAFVSRCQALTAVDEVNAGRAFEAAMDAHAEAEDPFEEARTRLLYGSRLRRTGQRVAAREHLARARDAFESMDLTHWSVTARDELAATGATARRRSDPSDLPLTSQETRVALLAAQGMSNREIGASLFLSPKTIERHLTNVFRKRGFRSRTELAAAYAQTPNPPR
jgi:DNA-binding CsgD family transcriptional regulator